MELTTQITPALQLNAVFSWLDARYSNFSTASVPSALKPFLVGSPRYDPVRGTYDASGNYLNYAPGSRDYWALNTTGSWHRPGLCSSIRISRIRAVHILIRPIRRCRARVAMPSGTRLRDFVPVRTDG
jgi:hypothetical protein